MYAAASLSARLVTDSSRTPASVCHVHNNHLEHSGFSTYIFPMHFIRVRQDREPAAFKRLVGSPRRQTAPAATFLLNTPLIAVLIKRRSRFRGLHQKLLLQQTKDS
jgi:hypothetical protein